MPTMDFPSCDTVVLTGTFMPPCSGITSSNLEKAGATFALKVRVIPIARGEQHAAEAGVERQPGEVAAEAGHLAVAVEGAEFGEQREVVRRP